MLLSVMPLLLMLSAILSAIATATYCYPTISVPIVTFMTLFISTAYSLEHMFLLTVQTKWYQWLKWFTKRHLTVHQHEFNCLNRHCKKWQFDLQTSSKQVILSFSFDSQCKKAPPEFLEGAHGGEGGRNGLRKVAVKNLK